MWPSSHTFVKAAAEYARLNKVRSGDTVVAMKARDRSDIKEGQELQVLKRWPADYWAGE